MRLTITLLSLCSLIVLNAQTDTLKVSEPDSLDVTGWTNPTFASEDLDNQSDDQAVAGLLQSNRDVFLNNAGFNFSAARFRVRGMNSNNFTVMLNGIPMNDVELGWAIWANWGGLNDITRYPESGVGVSQNDYHFGGIQGYSNISMRATDQRPGTRISYSSANRTYRNRFMVTHSTGLMDNDLAVSGSMSGRWSDEGYVEGTSYSNLSYFLSVEKKFDEKHSIGVIGLGSPSLRGRAGIVTQEVYDLRDDNFYNPYWGYQQGEKRNSRLRYNNQPIVMAWHEYKMDEKTSLHSTVYSQFGSYYETRLNWDDANDPRPDYYRNLPSYSIFDGEPQNVAGQIEAWENDESSYQIDWDSFYQANYKNLHTVDSVGGVVGNSFTGYRSKYILEEAHSDPFMLGFNTRFSKQLNETNRVNAGFNYFKYKSDNYKVVNDFLGGEYWLDVDRFALTDFLETGGFNSDLNNPNNVVQEDERYGYNYEIHQNTGEAFVQYSSSLEDYDYYIAATAGMTSFWRDGKFKNGLFPANSFGESSRSSFLTGGIKAGVNYKLTGRHFISMNAAFLSKAPLTRNAFLSPRNRNTNVPGLENEKVSSVDLNYLIRFPRLKGRLTWYTAAVKDQVSVFTFFDEQSFNLVNLVTSDIDHLYTGLELGIEANVTSTVTLTGALAKSQNIFTSRPTVTTVIDNLDEVANQEVAYLKDYRIGRSPQTALNVGITYRDPHFWFTGVNYSYFADNWLEPFGNRRTELQAANLIDNDPQWDAMFKQTQLENGGVLNFFAGKSWRFDRKYYLLITANVSNVLNEKEFITGGYEQGRPTYSTIDLFDNKYGYMYGRTYFAMIRFSF